MGTIWSFQITVVALVGLLNGYYVHAYMAEELYSLHSVSK